VDSQADTDVHAAYNANIGQVDVFVCSYVGINDGAIGMECGTHGVDDKFTLTCLVETTEENRAG
jgi:hypothetical protein